MRRPPALPWLLAVAVAALLPTAGRAQQIGTAVTPDTIYVGDVFRAAVRVVLPPGWGVTFPDTLPVAGEVENAGRGERRSRELPGGGREVTIVYPLTAWSPGSAQLPALSLRLESPEGERSLEATFSEPRVRSVLPRDTAGIESRPPKDVLGPGRLVWPWIAALAALLAAVVALVYWRRRRRAATPALSFETALADSSRERALRALDEVRSLGLVERGEVKEFYSRTVGVVRALLEELSPAWGGELTTTELIKSLEAGGLAEESTAHLAPLLEGADQVKFNRRHPASAEAFGEWSELRRWVEGVELPRERETAATDAAEEAGAAGEGSR
jgi:hypothetical protein